MSNKVPVCVNFAWTIAEYLERYAHGLPSGVAWDAVMEAIQILRADLDGRDGEVSAPQIFRHPTISYSLLSAVQVEQIHWFLREFYTVGLARPEDPEQWLRIMAACETIALAIDYARAGDVTGATDCQARFLALENPAIWGAE